MNENMNVNLKKFSASAAAMFVLRAALMGGSVVAGVAVGKKVTEMSGNKVVGVGAGIGTAAAVDATANRIARPIYKKFVGNLADAAEDFVKESDKYMDQLTPEEQETFTSCKEKINNIKEEYNI